MVTRQRRPSDFAIHGANLFMAPGFGGRRVS